MHPRYLDIILQQYQIPQLKSQTYATYLPTYLCNSQLKLLGSSIPTYSYLYVRKSAVVY